MKSNRGARRVRCGSYTIVALDRRNLRSITDIPRQQRLELLDGASVGKLGEQARQIGMGLNAIGLRSLDERIQSSARGGARLGIGK